MHRSLHIGLFLLIFINVVFGLLAMLYHFNSYVLSNWGAMSGSMPAAQSLSEFPPFVLFHIHSGILAHTLTGTPLLIVRAIYASFLHFSIVHLMSNMYALYELGYMFEELNYPGLLIPVYLVTGICSMLSALIFNPNSLTAGASGAIFGIMGAMVSSAIKAKFLAHLNKIDSYTANNYSNVSAGVVSAIVINLIVTFTTPNISIPGHLGGLVSGLIIGLLIPIRKS